MTPEELKNKKENLKMVNNERVMSGKKLEKMFPTFFNTNNIFNKTPEEATEILNSIPEEDRKLAIDEYKKGKAAKDSIDKYSPEIVSELKDRLHIKNIDKKIEEYTNKLQSLKEERNKITLSKEKSYALNAKYINTHEILSARESQKRLVGIFTDPSVQDKVGNIPDAKNLEEGFFYKSMKVEKYITVEDLIKKLNIKPLTFQQLALIIDSQSELEGEFPKIKSPLIVDEYSYNIVLINHQENIFPLEIDYSPLHRKYLLKRFIDNPLGENDFLIGGNIISA